MTYFRKVTRLVSAAALVAALVAPGWGQAETLIGSNVDSRVLVGFKVDAGDVQAMMPKGWTAIAYPKGPTAGANLLVSFEDRLLARDAEGKPTDQWAGRNMAFLGLGKQAEGDQVRLFVLRVFSGFDGQNAFGNAVAAEVSRDTATDAARGRSETWAVTTPEGKATFSLSFTAGRPIWSEENELRVFSNADPDVSVINRYAQLVDVVSSAAMNKPLSGTISFETTIPELIGLFDGMAEPVAVLDLPVYVRQQYAP